MSTFVDLFRRRLRGHRDPAPPRAGSLTVAALCLTAAAATCTTGKDPAQNPQSTTSSDTGTAPEAAKRLEVDLFAFGRVLGTIAPCGCTTEPLGGLQYAFGYLETESEAGRRLVLEPGSFLYPDPGHPEAPTDEPGWAQATDRAALLQSRFAALGADLVSGLGPTDFVGPDGAGAVSKHAMPRAAANLSTPIEGVEPRRTVSLGDGITAAITTVIDPALARDGLALGDPLTAATEHVKKSADATFVVVMVQGPRELAERIARDVSGVDFVVMGGPIEGVERGRTGTPVAQLGKAWLLEPGDRGQSITHFRIVMDASLSADARTAALDDPTKWTVVPPKAQRKLEVKQLEDKLAKFEGDASADPAFLERLRKQRDALVEALKSDALPEAPVVVVFEQVKVTCHRPVDETAKKALTTYDGKVAEENEARFKGVKAPEPAKGDARYVGGKACADCHEEAAAHWDATVHARAYETLVSANKQFDLSCVGCHVTGFRKPGGSEVVENEGLRDVQCEQCHGPGSAHVEDPSTDNIAREVQESLCLGCHTEEHSDTFEFKAYLRDILGPGHGPDAHKALGEGPTGKELRQAGLAKAGGGCPKM